MTTPTETMRCTFHLNHRRDQQVAQIIAMEAGALEPIHQNGGVDQYADPFGAYRMILDCLSRNGCVVEVTP